MSGVYVCAGEYRDIGVTVGPHVPPEWQYVPGLVEQFCEKFAELWAEPGDDVDESDLAALALWRLNWIHPYGGGNGRTSRAAAYLVIQARLGFQLPGERPFPELLVERRDEMIAALREADQIGGLTIETVVDLGNLVNEVLEEQLS